MAAPYEAALYAPAHCAPCSSLYIHIPFCHAKCTYCDFYSEPRGTVPDEYVAACIAELRDIAERGLLSPLSTVYIGGGTPSLLTGRQLKSLLDAARAAAGFSIAAVPEITIEANPEDIDEPFLAGAYDAGCTRLSVGVQCLHDAALACVGRVCRSARIRRALSLIAQSRAAQNGWPCFSVDLISGLPELDEADFSAGIAETLSYVPDHVSLYALTAEEGTPLYAAVQNGALRCDEEENESQWLLGRELLERHGYAQYEVSNFAKTGAQCCHNLVYWRLGGYAGVGAGAAGTYFDGAGGALRLTGPADEAAYAAGWNGADAGRRRAGYDAELLDRDTVCFEAVMMGLRTREGIAERAFDARFKQSLAAYLGADTPQGVFSRWQEQGYAGIAEENGGRRFFLTKDGLLFLNRFLRELQA